MNAVRVQSSVSGDHLGLDGGPPPCHGSDRPRPARMSEKMQFQDADGKQARTEPVGLEHHSCPWSSSGVFWCFSDVCFCQVGTL